MVTENDKRTDKFMDMPIGTFNTCIGFALRNGERKIAYSGCVDGVIRGGMADNIEDALYWCSKLYESNSSIILGIADYREAVAIWQHKDILHELGILSDLEYSEYIDSIDLED